MKITEYTRKPDLTRRLSLYSLWQAREAFVWIAGLALMATMDPFCNHGTLCPLSTAGFDWCPGCGLGHSIAWLFRGELYRSVHAHFLGIPAITILLIRVIHIFHITFKYKTYGTSTSLHS